MAKSVDKAVLALVEALEASEIGTIRKVHIDIQASGEYPYRIEVAEEPLPVPGVAKAG